MRKTIHHIETRTGIDTVETAFISNSMLSQCLYLKLYKSLVLA